MACASAIFVLWGAFIWGYAAVWAPAVRGDQRCNQPAPTDGMSLSAEDIGLPPSDATVTPRVGMARDIAQDSTSWPAGPDAPARAVVSGWSSVLLPNEGGTHVPSEAIRTWIQIDAGTTVLTVCVDGGKGGSLGIDQSSGVAALRLPHGTYAGFVAIPTDDPKRTLTVRQELSVQAAYAGVFWPGGVVLLIVGFGLAAEKLARASATARWLVLVTGSGAFASAYWSAALSNPSWGGVEAMGGLVAATFTATSAGIAAAAAVASGGSENPPTRETVAPSGTQGHERPTAPSADEEPISLP